MQAIERVTATDAARALIERLRAEHGEVFFYQSHGCCDGSTPICLAPGEMTLGPGDVLYGHVAGAAFWLGREQRDYFAGVQLTLDAVPGSNGAYSLEDGCGVRFVLRQRLWTDEEAQTLRAQA